MTDGWDWIDGCLGIGLLTSLLAVAWGHVAARRYYRPAPRPARHTRWPFVSILKPIEGVDPNTRDALASYGRLEYPGQLEVIVGYLRDEDPIVDLVREVQREFPRFPLRLVRARLLGANRKSSIMEALWREARGTHCLFSDADVSVRPDYATRVVEELLEPGVGCVTCLPRPVGARTTGGRLIALHYGFQCIPQWMLARHTTGIAWAIGHTMAVTRDVLERLGGFRGFLNHLADDYELGRRTTQLGLRVVLAPVLVDCAMPEDSFVEAVVRLQRWKRTIRRARGPASLGVVVTVPVAWATLWLLSEPTSIVIGSLWGAVVVLRILGGSFLQAALRLPDWNRIGWMLPLVDLLEFGTLVGAYTGDRIHWRGRRYRLLPDGTLSPCPQSS